MAPTQRKSRAGLTGGRPACTTAAGLPASPEPPPVPSPLHAKCHALQRLTSRVKKKKILLGLPPQWSFSFACFPPCSLALTQLLPPHWFWDGPSGGSQAEPGLRAKTGSAKWPLLLATDCSIRWTQLTHTGTLWPAPAFKEEPCQNQPPAETQQHPTHTQCKDLQWGGLEAHRDPTPQQLPRESGTLHQQENLQNYIADTLCCIEGELQMLLFAPLEYQRGNTARAPVRNRSIPWQLSSRDSFTGRQPWKSSSTNSFSNYS